MEARGLYPPPNNFFTYSISKLTFTQHSSAVHTHTHMCQCTLATQFIWNACMHLQYLGNSEKMNLHVT